MPQPPNAGASAGSDVEHIMLQLSNYTGKGRIQDLGARYNESVGTQKETIH